MFPPSQLVTGSPRTVMAAGGPQVIAGAQYVLPQAAPVPSPQIAPTNGSGSAGMDTIHYQASLNRRSAEQSQKRQYEENLRRHQAGEDSDSESQQGEEEEESSDDEYSERPTTEEQLRKGMSPASLAVHPRPVQTNLADFLLDAAATHPDDVCMETVQTTFTYAQMARMAQAIRHVLRQALERIAAEGAIEFSAAQPLNYPPPPFHGRRRDEHIILIVLDRGPECMAAIHATMMERCIYNAFDTTEPREKLQTWAEIASPPVMLCNKEVMTRLGLTERGWSFGPYPKTAFDVQQVLLRSEDKYDAVPPKTARADDLDRLCYVIFTSGSTGKPKAVMLQHHSAINIVEVWSDFVGIRKEERYAQMASMAFDNHVVEVYGTMHKKGTMVVVPDMTKRSGPDLMAFFKLKQVSGACVVPSMLRSVSGQGTDVSRKALPLLRLLDCGGEALGADVLEAWGPGRRFFNIYGPTEAAVVCTGCRVKPGDKITIGWDLETYKNIVLDKETLKPQPLNEKGVLYTAGVGVARGYLDDVAKTADKFSLIEGLEGLGRLYNTGDVCSKDERGRICYHGRADWQVKVRGVRIELEALEEAVGNCPGVNHCEARVVNDGQKLIVIASGNDPDEDTIKDYAGKLGKAYRPNQVYIVDDSAWKFNTSSKLVRKHVQIDAPEASAAAPGAPGAADQPKDGWETLNKADCTDLELDIARAVAQLVSPDSWNRDSHFIEDLGITSAGFGLLITLMRREAKLKLVNLPMLFDNPTVKRLAESVSSKLMEQGEVSDDEEEEDEEKEAERGAGAGNLDKAFLRAQKVWPLKVCIQEGMTRSLTYSQILQRAVGISTSLRRRLRELVNSEVRSKRTDRSSGLSEEPWTSKNPDKPILIVLSPCVHTIVAVIAVQLNGRPFLLIDPELVSPEGFHDFIYKHKPAGIITSAQASNALRMDRYRIHIEKVCAVVGVEITSDAAALLAIPLKPKRLKTRASKISFVAANCAGGQIQALEEVLGKVSIEAREDWSRILQATAEDRIVHQQDVGYEHWVLAHFAGLAQGSTVLLRPEGPRLDQSTLAMWMGSVNPTIVGSTPARLAELASLVGVVPHARTVWAASDAPCPPDIVKRWIAGKKDRRFLELKYTMNSFMPPRLHNSHPKVESDTPGGHHMHGSLSNLRTTRTRLLEAQRDFNYEMSTDDSSESSDSEGGGGGGCCPCGRSKPKKAQFEHLEGVKRHGTGTEAMRPTPTLDLVLMDLNIDDDEVEDLYGEGAHPRLCFFVQTMHMLFTWLFQAVMLVVGERYILPWTLKADPWVLVLVLVVGTEVFKILKLIWLVLVKWILIGRYRPGKYPIYSCMYLKHWLVEQYARGTPAGKDDQGAQGWAFEVGKNFLKNVALKLLGADVAWSATVTAQCAGFDCISIGPLASVHGPYHFTAIRYIGKTMIIDNLKVGAGAHLGQQSVMTGGSTLEDGAFVEPLSAIPSGQVLAGRWSGVPARQIRPHKEERVPKKGDGCMLVAAGLSTFLIADLFTIVTGNLTMIYFLLFARYLSPIVAGKIWDTSPEETAYKPDVYAGHNSTWGSVSQIPEETLLPPYAQDFLWTYLVYAIFGAVTNVILKLFGTVLCCRLLPSVPIPCDLPLYGIRAQIAAFKLRLAAKASEFLGDASIQHMVMRMCGAKVGRGSSMSEQVMLPETVEIGEGNFYASGNTLLNMEVDQGRMRVLSKTVMADNVFLGNTNHIAEGLPRETFAGLHTWVPKMVKNAEGSAFFGNPAMRFARPHAPDDSKGLLDGTCSELFWYHFSTTGLDLFCWSSLKALEPTIPLVVCRTLFPEYTSSWQFFAEVFIFAFWSLFCWYIMAIRLCNCIYHDGLPLENTFFSPVVRRWFNANKIRKVFKAPFQAAGVIGWHSRLMRIQGVHVGHRFFSPNEDVMIDVPFGRLGDDITVDYDAQVRQHSFEDNLLKWGPYFVGNGTSLLQGSALAMSDAGEYVVLMPGSVSWKGQKLESDTVYEGAPAAPVACSTDVGMRP
eukprot:TRINITY_DN24637_c0_g2_i1.p1 TRINITY_DN24637_c0_g2~~TRINITY_DN24637_c0_g2_i1.p1  ORF type:complete len:2003 (-),score=355.39 TRINITY_DN24637_c0_g2_i1:159-6167(-)